MTRTPNKGRSKPSIGQELEIDERKNMAIFSPSTQRKAGVGGISEDYFSPGKRQKNFTHTLNFWESKSKIISSESEIPAEHHDELCLVLKVDNRSGASRLEL